VHVEARLKSRLRLPELAPVELALGLPQDALFEHLLVFVLEVGAHRLGELSDALPFFLVETGH